MTIKHGGTLGWQFFSMMNTASWASEKHPFAAEIVGFVKAVISSKAPRGAT